MTGNHIPMGMNNARKSIKEICESGALASKTEEVVKNTKINRRYVMNKAKAIRLEDGMSDRAVLRLVEKPNIKEAQTNLKTFMFKFLCNAKLRSSYLVLEESLCGLNIDRTEMAVVDLFCLMDIDDAKKFRNLVINLLRAKKRIANESSMGITKEMIERVESIS